MKQNLLHTIIIILFGVTMSFFFQVDKYSNIYDLNWSGVVYDSLSSINGSLVDFIYIFKTPHKINLNGVNVDNPKIVVDKTNFYVEKNKYENGINNIEVRKEEFKNSDKLNESNSNIGQIVEEPRVLIIGDSMISGGFGVVLEKHLLEIDKMNVKRYGKPSTGLSRPDYFNWEEKFIELYEEFKPNTVVVMFGANDGQSIRGTEFGSIRESDPRWDEEYKKRVESMGQIFSERELRVYWVGNPIAKTEKYSNKMNRINIILKEVAESNLNIEYIDTWDILKDNQGQYSDYLIDDDGNTKLARSQDGIHVTRFGGEKLVEGIKDEFKILDH